MTGPEILAEVGRLQQHDVGRGMGYSQLIAIVALAEVTRLVEHALTYYTGRPTR